MEKYPDAGRRSAFANDGPSMLLHSDFGLGERRAGIAGGTAAGTRREPA
jgi:hypothetical protein